MAFLGAEHRDSLESSCVVQTKEPIGKLFPFCYSLDYGNEISHSLKIYISSKFFATLLCCADHDQMYVKNQILYFGWAKSDKGGLFFF